MADQKQTTFKKPNTAIVMLPRVGKLTVLSRKLFNSLMHSGQKQLIERRAAGLSLDATEFFEGYLIDIIRPIGSPTSHSLELMKNHIREMQSVRVEWTSPDAGAAVTWNSMVLISQAKLSIQNGKVRVLWSFPPDIVASLADPTRFTVIRLEELAKLNRYVAVALYEICARYSDNPSHKTSSKPKEWWVEALSSDAPKRDSKTKTTAALRDWRKFKLEQVLPAISEINANTGLFVELIEERSGRSITNVQFSVHRQHAPSAETIPGKDLSAPCYIQAMKLGLQAKLITTFILNGYSESQVQLALYKAEARIGRTDLAAIENITSYFRKILTEEPPGAPAPQSSTPQVTTTPAQPMAEAEISPAIPAVALPPPPKTKLEELTQELLNLSAEEQAHYVQLTRQNLIDNKMLSPLLARRFDNGTWAGGYLIREVTRIYHEEKMRMARLAAGAPVDTKHQNAPQIQPSPLQQQSPGEKTSAN